MANISNLLNNQNYLISSRNKMMIEYAFFKLLGSSLISALYSLYIFYLVIFSFINGQNPLSIDFGISFIIATIIFIGIQLILICIKIKYTKSIVAKNSFGYKRIKRILFHVINILSALSFFYIFLQCFNNYDYLLKLLINNTISTLLFFISMLIVIYIVATKTNLFKSVSAKYLLFYCSIFIISFICILYLGFIFIYLTMLVSLFVPFLIPIIIIVGILLSIKKKEGKKSMITDFIEIILFIPIIKLVRQFYKLSLISKSPYIDTKGTYIKSNNNAFSSDGNYLFIQKNRKKQ